MPLEACTKEHATGCCSGSCTGHLIYPAQWARLLACGSQCRESVGLAKCACTVNEEMGMQSKCQSAWNMPEAGCVAVGACITIGRRVSDGGGSMAPSWLTVTNEGS
jgi:hypothetical protein